MNPKTIEDYIADARPMMLVSEQQYNDLRIRLDEWKEIAGRLERELHEEKIKTAALLEVVKLLGGRQ